MVEEKEWGWDLSDKEGRRDWENEEEREGKWKERRYVYVMKEG